MNKSNYYLLGAFFLVAGIVLAVLGLKFDADEAEKEIETFTSDDNAVKGYVAMMVIGFVLIFISLVLFIVGYRKSENQKMNL